VCGQRRGYLPCVVRLLLVDSDFWRAYAGPCVSKEPAGSHAAHLRDQFRKWLFHLDGNWVHDFQGFVDEALQSYFGADFTRLLSDATYLVSGVMPHDNSDAIATFTSILAKLLTEYNPSQVDERIAAEALVVQVEHRDDVFTEAQVKKLASIYDQSVERAIIDMNLQDHGPEPSPFLDTLDDQSDDERILGEGNHAWGMMDELPLLHSELDSLFEPILPADDIQDSMWAEASTGM